MKPGQADEDVQSLQRTTGKPRRKLRAVLFATLFLVSAAGSLFGQPQHAEESQVKAAFLYNFGKFVRWPNPPVENSFTICILGQDPFGTALNAIVAGEAIDGKPIGVRRIANVDEGASCRILYIGSSEQSRLSAILAALNKHPVLTVSDIPKFAERGGMIQFVLEENRERFEINMVPAGNAGLTMSSELLKVAVRVRRDQKGGD